jgi:hypothetical protein
MNKKHFITKKIFSILVLSLLSSCSNPRFPNEILTIPSSPKVNQLPSLVVPQKSAIREIDFGNFRFPSIPPDRTTIQLRDGILQPTRNEKGLIDEMGASLLTTIYGDVTNDQKEDVIIILSLQTGGSALPNYIYVYSIEGKSTNLLKSFYTGDRADGGLRQIRIVDGNIILETYNPKGKKGDCCPIFFDRVVYKWKSGKFIKKGKKETLPNEEGNGSPLT